jgi:FkbM family methyltransferase
VLVDAGQKGVTLQCTVKRDRADLCPRAKKREPPLRERSIMASPIKQLTRAIAAIASIFYFLFRQEDLLRTTKISPGYSAPRLGTTKLADGCYHIFLDVGANIGVHSRFLFEPDKYPRADRAHGIFDSKFGDRSVRDNRDLCAFAFEPNPNHASRHEALEAAYRLQGWRYHYVAAAVSNENGNMTFYHNNDEQYEEWGFSDHDLSAKGDPVSVPKIRLSNWLMEEVYMRQLPKDVYGSYAEGPKVVMKMDIESQEYAVLPDVMFSGSVCKTVHFIFGEYHPWAIEYNADPTTGRGGLRIAHGEGKKKIADFVSFFHSFRDCELNTHFVELDDESYLHDGVPLPNATRS